MAEDKRIHEEEEPVEDVFGENAGPTRQAAPHPHSRDEEEDETEGEEEDEDEEEEEPEAEEELGEPEVPEDSDPKKDAEAEALEEEADSEDGEDDEDNERGEEADGDDESAGDGEEDENGETQEFDEDDEPVELPVKEGQTKEAPNADTEIVKPKKRRQKDVEIHGRKQEDDETEIYRPENEQKYTVKINGERTGDDESDVYKPGPKEGNWAKETPVSEEIARAVEEEEEKMEDAPKKGAPKQAEERGEEADKDEDEEDGDSEHERGVREEDVIEDELDMDEWDIDINQEGKPPSTEGIRKRILDRAQKESVRVSETSVPLNFLENPENKEQVFIGRKKSVFAKHGEAGALYVGKVGEDEHRDHNVYLDSLNPHVVFVCGARGSGKSYVLGVIAEELAKKNNNVGIVVIDPIGVFWSMKHPNREKREIESMADWGLLPEGLENLKVFVPQGVVGEIPKSTYDASFSMRPSLLNAEDWCLTFGIERFSPTGLLMEKALGKVEKGYRTQKTETKKSRVIKPKGKKYGIDDIISCLETDDQLNSRDKGYKQDSIRALVSRFEAAKSWGIFDAKGTPLSELSREGQLTVMDTSFLDDTVTALVIGILSRRLLAARKVSTRKEASKKFDKKDMDALLELEVPPTWLFIDEAHTLIPSGNQKTPATTALIEYVKQGRRPGLSLVFATQQPSAIDTKVLSQLDVIMTHKLIFDDDVKAVYKRTPTIIPMKYRKPTFIKTLPVGVALTGDRAEETSRAFVMRIRPRLSQHEGRDAETTEATQALSEKEVEELLAGMVRAKLEKEGMLERDKILALVDTLNTKYKAKCDAEKILKGLKKDGFVLEDDLVRRKDFQVEDAEDEEAGEDREEGPIDEAVQSVADAVEESAEAIDDMKNQPKGEATELVALSPLVSEAEAKNLFDRARRKKVLGLFGGEEQVKRLGMRYRTVWKVHMQAYDKRSRFQYAECYVDSVSGEFLHFKGKEFIESKGLQKIFRLDEDEIATVLDIAYKKRVPLEKEKRFRRIAKKLMDQGVIGAREQNGIRRYYLKQDFDLPPTPSHELLASLSKMRFAPVAAAEKQVEQYSREDVMRVLQRLWPNVLVKKVEEVYRPFYEATLEKQGETRTMRIDAITGKKV